MCDGHIGAISRSVTFNGNELNGQLVKWNRTWVEGLISELSFTEVVNIPIVRVDKVVKTLVGIRDYLGFTFDAEIPDSVTCHRMVGDGEPKTIFFQNLAPDEETRLAAQALVEDAAVCIQLGIPPVPELRRFE